MLRKPPYRAALAALVAATALLLAPAAAPAPAADGRAPTEASAPVRIMPLGDSITGSPGCWRALLFNHLRDTGYRDIDFVGTLGAQGCGVPYDGDNEGHGGALVTNVANQNQLPAWLSATNPDIVLMHFGTNDVWSNRSTSAILAAYSTLVDQMRVNNPDMRILVAKIIPMAPATCAECGQRVVALNDAIPGWAAGKSTPRSPITVVDQWTGFSTATDTYDGVHPNSVGDRKMSDRWYPALVAALAGANPPTTPPATFPTTTPQGNEVCTAGYRLINEWQGGFQGEVIVTNTGTTAITGWTVGMAFGAGQQINQAWNATVTQNGNSVTARNLSWNGDLSPDGTASFGFTASWTGTNPVPSTTCSAG
jgi:lysophospholipase L1-like esterase